MLRSCPKSPLQAAQDKGQKQVLPVHKQRLQQGLLLPALASSLALPLAFRAHTLLAWGPAALRVHAGWAPPVLSLLF